MKVAIIGAGLGGLLSGAYLSTSGHEVEIFERLPIIGGRFTNIDINGFQLSTGALHMIPHGPTGPLAQLLNKVGADVKIMRNEPTSTIRIPEENGAHIIPFSGYKDTFSGWKKLKLAILLITTRKFPPKDRSLDSWISKHLDSKLAHGLADAFCGWALSLKAKDVPVEEAFEIFENLYRYGGPGVPLGGCKGISDALAEVIGNNGGKIHTRTEVTEVITDAGQARSVLVDGREVKADLVISDIGHLQTAKLCTMTEDIPGYAPYMEKLHKIKPSAGIKICLASDRPLIGNGSVLLTPGTRRVNGINEVTNVDPNLAPAGKHLVMAHQTVTYDRLDHLEEEIDLGLKDLQEIFPDREFEVLLTQSHHDGWPVNRSASGTDLSNSTPVKGLYIVGDGAKGKGGIEIEGIALGVMQAMEFILSPDTKKN